MPVKVKYVSTIIKQGYRYDNEKLGIPLFNEAMIGVEINKDLYAETKEIAYNVLDTWNKDIYYEYKIKEVEEIIHDEIPRNTFFYETKYYGKYNYER